MVKDNYRRRSGLRNRSSTWFTSSKNPSNGHQNRRAQSDAQSPQTGNEDTYNPPIRLSKKVFDLAKDTSDGVILPTRLRPRDSVEDHDQLDADEDLLINQSRVTGNFILNLNLVEEHFNESINVHRQQHPQCNGLIVSNPTNSTKVGWAYASTLHCMTCEFETQKLKFYEEEQRLDGPGKRAAKINKQMAVALSKQSIGYTSMIEILATCEINPPSVEGMRKTSNQVADALININNEQLIDNRKLVKQVKAIRSGKAENPIAIATDAAYNNSPKGRSFYLPATQAYAPVFSSEPGLEHIPLAIATVSKLCSCPHQSNGTHETFCQRNYPLTRSIGAAEKTLGELVGKELLQGGPESSITAGKVVTDGVGPGSMFKGIQAAMEDQNKSNSMENQDCSKHISATLRRNMRKIDLQSVYIDTSTAVLRKKKRDRLLDHVSQRCSWEFRGIQSKYKTGDTATLITKCQNAKVGIIACIQGDRETCIRNCLTCYIHCKNGADKQPRRLPDARYVSELSDEDAAKIMKCMDKKLGPEAVHRQRYNLTMNNCEASHRTTQRCLPKNRTYKRTFRGRANGAVHSMAMGHIKSTLLINKKLNVPNAVGFTAFNRLRKNHKRYNSQRKRRQYESHKKQRMQNKLRVQRNRAVAEDFGHAMGLRNQAVSSEHSYVYHD